MLASYNYGRQSGAGSVAKRYSHYPATRRENTLFAIVPLILAIMTMLPPFPNRIICLATACAVMNTPVTLTSIMVLASLAEYSNAGVSCWIPAAAMRPSMRPSTLAISSMTAWRSSVSRTSIRRYSSLVPRVVALAWMRGKSSLYTFHVRLYNLFGR